MSKSGVTNMNLDKYVVKNFASEASCAVNEWPLLYLGLPLGGTQGQCLYWDSVVERMSKRFDGWKRVYFTLGGRISLIKACLTSIPLYYLSLFRIPVAVTRNLEKMMRNFLWFGMRDIKRDHLLCWETICKPLDKGRLGFGNLVFKNISLVGKWLRRFLLELPLT